MFYKQGLAASQLEEINNAWLKREDRFCTGKSELYYEFKHQLLF